MSARRPLLLPFVPLYAAAQRIADALRAAPRSLSAPVISVGSLSAGGAGKTPVVIALAQLLTSAGERVSVLSRGYGRTAADIAQVDPTLPNATTRFGDEPVLIALRTTAAVFVGADRHAAGLLAERTVAPTLHLLDDGFQHRRLARALNIVLVTAEDLEDTQIPAGNLREALPALHRADVVVVREDEAADLQSRLWPLLREGAQIWTLRRTLRFDTPFNTSELAALGVFGAGLRPLAFCAIARPEGFEASLRAAGCGVLDTLAFADHARYNTHAVAQILTTAKQLNASGFITTEKDAVKLTAVHRAALEAHGPLLVAALDAVFVDSAEILRSIRQRTRARA